MAAAAQGRFRLIGTISVAFGCPFEGAVDADVVVADALRFGEIGVTMWRSATPPAWPRLRP